jgi:hypothetical protein
MLKLFGIESGDNEESREEQQDFVFVNGEQIAQLHATLCLPNGHYNEVGAKIATAFKLGPFEKVKASKFDLIMQTARSAHAKLSQTPPMHFEESENGENN